MKGNSKQGSVSPKKKPLTPARARRERDKADAIALYLKGHTMPVVRDLMEEKTGHNFSVGTIHKFINEGVVEWRQSKEHMVANHKEIELEKINRLESEYWDAWERSKLNYKATSETKTKGKSEESPGKLGTTSKRIDERASNGDPRFLEGIHRCVETRNKMLGIEVPQIQITNTNNNTSSSTTVVRRIVFKTRETTSKQEIEDKDAE